MHLGDCSFPKQIFSIEEILKKLKSLPSDMGREKVDCVNQALLDCIRQASEPCFLLSSVLDFVERVDRENILSNYSFGNFELWLNQSSGLSFEENLHIRGKIVGKFVDRSVYQAFFPIGMGKVYEGTHFVTAHKSPDLDTTISSFWGWVDAFGARVGDSLHVWNLPGGPPSSQIEIKLIFEDVFGKGVFTHLPKLRTTLNLVGKDLMSHAAMVIKRRDDLIMGADQEREHHAVVVVDDEGLYLGDWRSLDVEEVRQVIILLSMCLRWFENNVHLQMISLFSKEKLHFSNVQEVLKNLFFKSMKDCDPALDFSQKQRSQVSQFITVILGLEKGLNTSFDEMFLKLSQFVGTEFFGLDKLLSLISSLFSPRGEFTESRPQIFSFLEVVIRDLHTSILKTRERLEKLDVAIKTKYDVFGHHPTFVSTRSEVEEIRQKMGSYFSLTVADTENDKLYPLGVIQSQDIRKSILGTVSLRDFCNRDEMGIPPYLDVISVIDHHKTQLQTAAPPFAIIADAQSCNTLVAKQAFEINDKYSVAGMSLESIDSQIRDLSKDITKQGSILQRLLQKRNIAGKKTAHFIDPRREFMEYLHFMYGILDDTDLLSKVSASDVECVVSLLNRMKTIVSGRETEVVHLDDIIRDKNFPKIAARRILQNEEMYSLYSKVYEHRENEAKEMIISASKGKASSFFADTKVQNGCCRIGQTKVFVRNVDVFQAHSSQIRSVWKSEAVRINREKPEIDLHFHMVSTIVSADEVYKGSIGQYDHMDEMWIWIPATEIAEEHLKRFLMAFQLSPGLKNNRIELEFIGDRAKDFALLFKESFVDVASKCSEGDPSIVILRFKPGTLNSRKAMISPFLPTL